MTTGSTRSGGPVWRYAVFEDTLYRCSETLWPRAIWSDADGWITFPIEYEFEGETRHAWPSFSDVNGLREVSAAEAWRLICAWRDGIDTPVRFLERAYYDREPDGYEADPELVA